MNDFYRIRDLSATSPVILHAPHGGRVIPPEHLGAFVLSPDELEAEKDRMTDHFTNDLVETITGASAVINDMSRLVLDVERFPDDSEEMNAVGMGVLYTHGSQGQRIRETHFAGEAELLNMFAAYSAAFTDLVDATLAAHGRAVIIDVHSYPEHALPYELHGDQERPGLCIGYDPFHAPAPLVIAARNAIPQLHALANQPFAGAYVPLRYYNTDARVQSVMLEIRRDMYMDERAMTPDRERFDELRASLQNLVETLTEDPSLARDEASAEPSHDGDR